MLPLASAQWGPSGAAASIDSLPLRMIAEEDAALELLTIGSQPRLQSTHEEKDMPYTEEFVTRVQYALDRLNYDPGPVDGRWGLRTQAAVRSFQQNHGLMIDGLPGPRTRALLFVHSERRKQGSAAYPLGWLNIAQNLIDVKERVGAASNPLILDWTRALHIPFAGDSQPWCGLFVAHCLRASLPEEPFPIHLLSARSWLRFGRSSCTQMGAVMIFWRERPDSWKGHVGFCVGEDDRHFHILGGNQGDSVSVAAIDRRRLLEARWPCTAPIVQAGRANDPVSGLPLSVNEA